MALHNFRLRNRNFACNPLKATFKAMKAILSFGSAAVAAAALFGLYIGVTLSLAARTVLSAPYMGSGVVPLDPVLLQAVAELNPMYIITTLVAALGTLSIWYNKVQNDRIKEKNQEIERQQKIIEGHDALVDGMDERHRSEVKETDTRHRAEVKELQTRIDGLHEVIRGKLTDIVETLVQYVDAINTRDSSPGR